MKTIEEISNDYHINVAQNGEGFLIGTFRFSDGTFASIIVGENEDGVYDHVSVSMYNHRKMPTWEQMCEVKDACFNAEEEAYQIHPKKSEYVNMMPNCLHIWARHDGRGLFDA